MNGLDRKQAFCEPFPLSFASNANNHPIPVDRCQLTFTLVTLLTVSIYSQTSLSRAEPADLLTRLSLGEISLSAYRHPIPIATMASSSSNVVGVHYRVGKKIGEGSFGVIFEGTNLLNNQQVAIKFVRASSRWRSRRSDILTNPGTTKKRCTAAPR